MAPNALEGIFAGEGPASLFGPSPLGPFTFPRDSRPSPVYSDLSLLGPSGKDSRPRVAGFGPEIDNTEMVAVLRKYLIMNEN